MKMKSKKPSVVKAKTKVKVSPKKGPSASVIAMKRMPRSDAKLAGNSKVSSKSDAILALLHKPTGVTIASLMTTTGWQAHSLRGFFSGVVRKKLSLQLESEIIKGERRYRVANALR